MCFSCKTSLRTRESKGADQVCSNRAAGQCICLRYIDTLFVYDLTGNCECMLAVSWLIYDKNGEMVQFLSNGGWTYDLPYLG